MPCKREAGTVLAMVREVERKLNDVPLGSQRSDRLLDDWARLRIQYLRLSDLAYRQHRLEPDPWPEPMSPE